MCVGGVDLLIDVKQRKGSAGGVGGTVVVMMVGVGKTSVPPLCSGRERHGISHSFFH